MGDDHGNGLFFLVGVFTGVTGTLLLQWLANHVTFCW